MSGKTSKSRKRRKKRRILWSNRPKRRKSYKLRDKTLKGSINDIRKEPIPFDKDINILALEQSIGKTHRCIEYIKQHYKDKKILYLTSKHDKLNEVERELNSNSIPFRHWYGFTHKKMVVH